MSQPAARVAVRARWCVLRDPSGLKHRLNNDPTRAARRPPRTSRCSKTLSDWPMLESWPEHLKDIPMLAITAL